MWKRATFLIAVFLLFTSIAVSAQDIRSLARVTADGLRIRSDWNLEAEIVGGLMAGDVVDVLERSGGTQVIGQLDDYWYRVRTRDGLVGWSYGGFLERFVQLEFGGVSLAVGVDVADGVTARDVGAYTDRSGASWPGHIQMVFEAYAVPRAAQSERQVSVYPLAGHGGTGEESAAGSMFADAPERLNAFLRNLPSEGFVGGTDQAENVPVVPAPTGAHPAFVTALRQQISAGGEGVRFLTRYVQDLVWPPPEEITYVYQGYTRDGSAWITARFRVRRPSVPSDDTPRPPESRIREGYSRFAEEIGTLPADSFEPPLSSLDEVIRSISIAW